VSGGEPADKKKEKRQRCTIVSQIRTKKPWGEKRLETKKRRSHNFKGRLANSPKGEKKRGMGSQEGGWWPKSHGTAMLEFQNESNIQKCRIDL